MKPNLKKNRLRLVLILVVIFLFSLETAFAQDNAENATGSAQNSTRENPDTRMPPGNVARPGRKKKRQAFFMNLFNQSPQKRVTTQ